MKYFTELKIKYFMISARSPWTTKIGGAPLADLLKNQWKLRKNFFMKIYR